MDSSGGSDSDNRWGICTPLCDCDTGSKERSRLPWRPILILGAAVGVATLASISYFPIKRSLVRSLQESCRKARGTRDWDRLEQCAQNWLWWDPANTNATIYLAEAAAETGQYERAVGLLSALPDRDPITPAALLQCSTILFDQLNRPIEGAERLERAVRLDPRAVEPRRRLIFFYAFTLQRRKMAAHARTAIAYGCEAPDAYAYLMLRDSLSFANAYDQNTKWFRGDREQELFLVARAIYRIRTRGLDDTSDLKDIGPIDPDGVPIHAKVIQEYCRKFPRNLELLAYRTERAIAKGETDEVERLMAALPAEADEDNRFWRYRGWLQTARGEFAEAGECYGKALSLNGYDHLSRHQLASVLRRLKRLDEVKAQEDVAAEGKTLFRDILRAPSTDDISLSVLRRMLQYAEHCGDDMVASRLALRVRGMREAGAKP